MLALWGEAVRSIEERVKPTQRDQWLRPITFVGHEGSRIHLRAPNRYQKEWFEDHYLHADPFRPAKAHQDNLFGGFRSRGREDSERTLSKI
jgi:hypothetical protein